MSTVVCQGLQSSLESQLAETTTLRLKLSTPKSIGLGRGPCIRDNNEEASKKATNVGENQMSSWSFIQALSLTSQTPQKTKEGENTYVLPQLTRSSSSRLSEKSLELCTENLGSETGSDIGENSIIFSLEKLDSRPTSPRREPRKLKQDVESRNFPPPLTTIRGSNSLHVRTHREDGRLIMEAVEAPSRHTFLQAERCDGRLRLFFLEEYYAPNIDSQVTEQENGGISEENEHENDLSNEEDKEECEEESDEEEEDEQENDIHLGSRDRDMDMDMDMDGNSFKVEAEMGMQKFERPSRCKESGHDSNKGLCNWEPFWVATS